MKLFFGTLLHAVKQRRWRDIDAVLPSLIGNSQASWGYERACGPGHHADAAETSHKRPPRVEGGKVVKAWKTTVFCCSVVA